MKELKSNGVQGVIVSWKEDVYETAANLNDDFLAFMKNANESEIKVIVELSPVSSNKWFEKSEGKDDDFIDYYLWKDGVSGQPPNKWVIN